MKHCISYTAFFILFVLVQKAAFAQKKNDTKKEENKMGVMAKAYPHSVALRWAPANFNSWEQGKKYGYHVYRQDMIQGNKSGKEIQLTTNPLKPVSLEQFRKYKDTSEVAGKAIFAVVPDTSIDVSMDDALQKEDNRNFKYSMGQLMANVYPLVAKMSGLYYLDETAQNGQSYYYEIRIAHPTLSNTIKTWAFATPGTTTTMPKPYYFTGKSIKHNAVIQWRTDFVDFNYAYFDVYRADHHDKHFKKINKMPYVGLVGSEMEKNVTKFQDTLPSLDKSYYYKIVGVDPFGDPGPWSEEVMIKASQSIYFNPILLSATSINNKTVVLEWDHPEKDKKHIHGFVVQRADDPLNRYTNLTKVPLPHTHLRYEDKRPLPAGYYRIATIGIANDTTFSLNQMVQLIDSVPPATPTGIVATGDSNGVVTIHWHRNKEEDFYGYRVFRTFGKMDEYSRMVDFMKDTVYTDTIRKQSGYKKVFYVLVALDGHFNISDFTKPIEVKFPDLTPPSAPQLVNYLIKPNALRLEWVQSLSLDAISHTLLRKGDLDYDWVPLVEIPKGSKLDSLRSFVDTSAVPNTTYLYAIQATDDAGLKSTLSNQLKLTAIGDPYKPPVGNFKAFVDLPTSVIKLVWTYEQTGISDFVIYRKSKDGKLETLQNLASNVREYYDKNLKPNTEYSYYILAHFKDWSQSKLTEPLIVKY